jgi:hypothetical protein
LFFFLSLSKEKEGRESVGVGEAPKRQLLIGLTVGDRERGMGKEKVGRMSDQLNCAFAGLDISIIKGRLTATPDVNLGKKFQLWLV